MSETREFGVGAILSVTTGSLMCDLDDLYGILGWLTGEDLMTHQLPRAARESEGFLREQFPDLADIESPDWSSLPNWASLTSEGKQTKIESWLRGLGVDQTRDVPRLPENDHTRIDPLAEMRMIAPDVPIIPITPPAP